jgi:hypothetical protein
MPVSFGFPSPSVRPNWTACSLSHRAKACFGDLPLTADSFSMATDAVTLVRGKNAQRNKDARQDKHGEHHKNAQLDRDE